MKTSKTTSSKKNKTVSTTESSSVTSSKAASFENSFSNGSVEVVEQHHVVEHQAVHQESVTSNKSIDSSSATASIQDSPESPVVENGEKKKLNGKRKSKKSKKSDEKENISVVSRKVSIRKTPSPHQPELVRVSFDFYFVIISFCVFLYPVGCVVVLFPSDGLSSSHFALLAAC